MSALSSSTMTSALNQILVPCAIAAAALLLVPLAASAGQDEADDVARDIYRQVERACPAHGGGQPYNLATIADNYFVPELRDLLGEAYANNAVHFDVLIDAQDCSIRDVDIDVDGDEDAEDSQHVVARAHFKNFGERRVVDLLMVSDGREWKVVDVAYRHRDWSLRRDLNVRYSK